VAHGDVVANVDAILFFHAVEDGVVLNVGIMADANLVDVAAEDGVHPDAGVFSDDDVADELGGVVNVGGIGELGSDAFVGADHKIYQMLAAVCWTHGFAKMVVGVLAGHGQDNMPETAPAAVMKLQPRASGPEQIGEELALCCQPLKGRLAAKDLRYR
jgi:hypothetical protein